MIESNNRSQSDGIHPAYSSAVFNAITKDLSGEAGRLVGGVFLHIMPTLMLTEFQSERFYWAELRKMIHADIYLDDVRLDLDLKLIKPFPNRMYLALTEKRNMSGVYLPVRGAGEYDLRVEWCVRYGIGPDKAERITHTQKIVIDDARGVDGVDGVDDFPVLTIYSVPEASYEYNNFSGMSLKMYASSDAVATRERISVFGTTVERKDNHVTFSEAVKLVFPLDLYGASFFIPMLQRLKV